VKTVDGRTIRMNMEIRYPQRRRYVARNGQWIPEEDLRPPQQFEQTLASLITRRIPCALANTRLPEQTILNTRLRPGALERAKMSSEEISREDVAIRLVLAHREFYSIFDAMFAAMWGRILEPLVGDCPNERTSQQVAPRFEAPPEERDPNVLVPCRRPPDWAPQGVMKVDLADEIAGQSKIARMHHEARSKAIRRGPRPENLMKVANGIYEAMKAAEARGETV